MRPPRPDAERAGAQGERWDDARLREHLANERTLLAWIRLSLASAGFGFVVARFGLFLRATTGQADAPSLGAYAEVVGIGLVLLGPLLVTVGATRYFRTEREIERRAYASRHGSLWVVILANVALGLALALYLLLPVGCTPLPPARLAPFLPEPDSYNTEDTEDTEIR